MRRCWRPSVDEFQIQCQVKSSRNPKCVLKLHLYIVGKEQVHLIHGDRNQDSDCLRAEQEKPSMVTEMSHMLRAILKTSMQVYNLYNQDLCTSLYFKK
jgi:hypothetical protein